MPERGFPKTPEQVYGSFKRANSSVSVIDASTPISPSRPQITFEHLEDRRLELLLTTPEMEFDERQIPFVQNGLSYYARVQQAFSRGLVMAEVCGYTPRGDTDGGYYLSKSVEVGGFDATGRIVTIEGLRYRQDREHVIDVFTVTKAAWTGFEQVDLLESPHAFPEILEVPPTQTIFVGRIPSEEEKLLTPVLGMKR
jgi:hypothetical protein